MTEQALTTRENNVVPVSDTAAIIQVIERAAMNPDVDIDKMERLLQMQERIMTRNAEQAYNAALATLQAELPEITEHGEIRHGGKLISTYAKWEHVNRAIKPVLSQHGFSLSFRVSTDDKVRVEGVLSHREGHGERTSITLPADTSGSKGAVQAVASSVSYGKRYVASALLNIITHGEDDDGQAAVPIQRITPEQVANIEALITEVGADRYKFLKFMKASKVEDIQSASYVDAVKMLERKRNQK